MSFRAMMWGDPYCFQEYIYEFDNKKDYNECIKWSIESSIYFLETHVFRRRSNKKKYGFHIERYIINNRCNSRKSEKKLRHSVTFWKVWLNDVIQKEFLINFKLNDKLNSDIKRQIELYL